MKNITNLFQPSLVLVLILFSIALFHSCKHDFDEAIGITDLCADGNLNQDETSIDCGGVCAPCPFAGPPTSGYYHYWVSEGVETSYPGFNSFESVVNLCGNDNEVLFNGATWIDGFSSIEGQIFLSKHIPRGTSDNPDVHYELFKPGFSNYDEIALCSDWETKRAIINIVDEEGETWTTKDGEQSESTFEITFRGPSSGGYFPTAIIEGKFSCRLYNRAEVKVLTDGHFRFNLGLY